jgi:hypothetical protein
MSFRAMAKMNGKWSPSSRSEKEEPEMEVLDTETERGTVPGGGIYVKGFDMGLRTSLSLGVCTGKEDGEGIEAHPGAEDG